MRNRTPQFRVSTNKMKPILLKLILTISILLNIALVVILADKALMGCAEIANGRIGVLAQDIEVGYFGGNTTVFTLPKGLVVREASATGVDWFEPNRFRLVVTSERESLVDYSVKEEQQTRQDSEQYSADIHMNKFEKSE